MCRPPLRLGEKQEADGGHEHPAGRDQKIGSASAAEAGHTRHRGTDEQHEAAEQEPPREQLELRGGRLRGRGPHRRSLRRSHADPEGELPEARVAVDRRHHAPVHRVEATRKPRDRDREREPGARERRGLHRGPAGIQHPYARKRGLRLLAERQPDGAGRSPERRTDGGVRADEPGVTERGRGREGQERDGEDETSADSAHRGA